MHIASAYASHQQLTDDEIRQSVIGSWMVDTRLTNGPSIEGEVVIISDGSFVSKATLIVGEKRQKDGYEGTWQVKNGFLIETITNSESKFHLVGKITRDIIIHVDKLEMSYQTESGMIITRRRKVNSTLHSTRDAKIFTLARLLGCEPRPEPVDAEQ